MQRTTDPTHILNVVCHNLSLLLERVSKSVYNESFSQGIESITGREIKPPQRTRNGAATAGGGSAKAADHVAWRAAHRWQAAGPALPRAEKGGRFAARD